MHGAVGQEMGKELKAKKERGTEMRSPRRQKRREIMKRLPPASLLLHQDTRLWLLHVL